MPGLTMVIRGSSSAQIQRSYPSSKNVSKRLILKNYSTLKKEIKEDTNGSIYRVHGLKDLTSSKCPYYTK